MAAFRTLFFRSRGNRNWYITHAAADALFLPFPIFFRLKPLTERPTAAPADIWQVASHPKIWLRQVQGTESHYYRAVGSAEALMAEAPELGQVWMKGVAGEMAKKILRERPT